MWMQWLFKKKNKQTNTLKKQVNDPKMTFDPTSVEVTCLNLPKDHCISKSHERTSNYVDMVTLFQKTKNNKKIEPKVIDP